MCPNCRSLLLLGKDAIEKPEFATCPYCGLKTATTKDHGHFICPNCGIIRQPNNFQLTGENSVCSNCKKAVPGQAIYCKFCGQILKTDFSQPPLPEESKLAYDQDWKIGKDAEGHFYFARAILESIRKEVGKADETGNKADEIAKYQSSLLLKLKEALISVIEVLQEPKLRSNIEAIIPEIDMTYGFLLENELQNIQALTNQKLEDGALGIIYMEPHIPPRRMIEAMLADSLISSGSIGQWKEKLVNIERVQDVRHTFSRVKDYENLKHETTRFVAWKEQRDSLQFE
jgi:predicted RNA-binding Zn-ribbon protein involved in translation (DUF1610 family)